MAQITDADAILSRQLFFIAATEKSGTTWLQMMLDAHPNVVCRGEGQFAGCLTPMLGRAMREYSDFITGLNRQVFSETPGFPVFGIEDQVALVRFAAARLWAKCGIADETKAIGEKTPGNIRELATLERMFPGCRYIFIVRDPRDVIVSGHVHLKRQFGAKGDEPIETYARRVAKIWASDTQKALAAETAYPGRTIRVRYEDLHADPRGPVRAILGFLGVNAGDANVGACIEAGRFERLSGGRARGAENKASQFRKGIVGDWKTALPVAARAAVAEEARDALRAFGYAGDDSWVTADV